MRGTTGTLSHTCALVGKHVKRIVIGGVDGFSYLVAAAVLVFCCLFIHRSPLCFSPYFMLSVFLWNYSIFLFSIFYSSSLICVTWFSLVVPVVLCDLTRAVASVCFSSVSLNPVLNVRCFHVLGFFSLSLSFFSSSFSGRGLWVERNFAPLAHSLFSQCKARQFGIPLFRPKIGMQAAPMSCTYGQSLAQQLVFYAQSQLLQGHFQPFTAPPSSSLQAVLWCVLAFKILLRKTDFGRRSKFRWTKDILNWNWSLSPNPSLRPHEDQTFWVIPTGQPILLPITRHIPVLAQN